MGGKGGKLREARVLRRISGNDLQFYIDEAYRIWGNPIILYDVDLNVLAYAEGNMPFWDAFVHDGVIKNEIAELYMREGALALMTSPKQVMFLHNEQLQHHVIFAKIYDTNNLPIACVVIVAVEKPFEQDDLVAVKTLCKVLSVEMVKRPYFQHYAQAILDLYIGKLINGSIDDKASIAGQIEMIYKKLKANLYIAVADISQSTVCCDTHYYRDLFKQAQPACKYAVYSGHVIIILGTGGKSIYPKRSFGVLYEIFEKENIRVGVSGRFENLYELQSRYNDAIIALQSGMKANGDRRIFMYSDSMRAPH